MAGTLPVWQIIDACQYEDVRNGIGVTSKTYVHSHIIVYFWVQLLSICEGYVDGSRFVKRASESNAAVLAAARSMKVNRSRDFSNEAI